MTCVANGKNVWWLVGWLFVMSGVVNKYGFYVEIKAELLMSHIL